MGYQKDTLEKLTSDKVIQKLMLSGKWTLDHCPVHGYIAHSNSIINCPIVISRRHVHRDLPTPGSGFLYFRGRESKVIEQKCSLPFDEWTELTH